MTDSCRKSIGSGALRWPSHARTEAKRFHSIFSFQSRFAQLGSLQLIHHLLRQGIRTEPKGTERHSPQLFSFPSFQMTGATPCAPVIFCAWVNCASPRPKTCGTGGRFLNHLRTTRTC